MKATDQLKAEHEGIKLMIRIMNSVFDKGELNIEHLDKMLDFIKTFADKCHHGKEEDILFPAMEKAGMSREQGPIAVMLHEHDLGRSYIKELSAAMTRYRDGDKTSVEAIRENIVNYSDLLSSHIDKENNILFMMADRLFDDQKQQEILEAFEKIEIEKIGTGKHEEYHQLLKELQEIYL